MQWYGSLRQAARRELGRNPMAALQLATFWKQIPNVFFIDLTRVAPAAAALEEQHPRVLGPFHFPEADRMPAPGSLGTEISSPGRSRRPARTILSL